MVQVRRSVATVVSVLASALLLGGSGVAAQAEPAAVYRQLTEAINRGDAEGALALFSDDAVQESLRCTPCVGKEALRADLSGRVANHVQYTVLSTEVSGTTLTARSEVRSDTVRARGFERILNLDVMEVRGGRITLWRVRNDTSDAQTAAFVAAQAPPSAGAAPAPAPVQAPAALPRAGMAKESAGPLAAGGLSLALLLWGRRLRRRG